MKSLYKVITGAMILLVAESCGDMLNFYPHNAVSRYNLNDDDMELLYWGLYNCSQYKPGLDTYYFCDVVGGDLQRSGGSAVTPQTTIRDLITRGSGYVNGQWASYYTWLYQVNCFIAKAETLPSGETKDLYLGTGYFFRGLIYYNLVSRWREVPIISYPTNEKLAKSSESECWAFAEDNLDKAIACLGSFTGQSILCRAAAQALMARTKLAQGKMEEAAKYAEEVITSGNFSLDSYSNIWAAESNKEVIFAYSNAGAEENGLVMSSYFRGNPQYVPTTDTRNLFVSSDERMPWCTYADGQYIVLNKYDTYGGYDPIVVTRLSEMYLISAEAKGRVNGLSRLNELRTKRGLTEYAAFDNDSEYIEAVLKERRLELIGEGFRWFDLVRTGRYETALGLDTRYTVLPIPDREIELNSNLKQNPIWLISNDDNE